MYIFLFFLMHFDKIKSQEAVFMALRIGSCAAWGNAVKKGGGTQGCGPVPHSGNFLSGPGVGAQLCQVSRSTSVCRQLRLTPAASILCHDDNIYNRTSPIDLTLFTICESSHRKQVKSSLRTYQYLHNTAHLTQGFHGRTWTRVKTSYSPG